MRNALPNDFNRLAYCSLQFVCLGVVRSDAVRDAPSVESDAHTAQTPFVAAGDMEQHSAKAASCAFSTHATRERLTVYLAKATRSNWNSISRDDSPRNTDVTPIFIYVDAREEIDSDVYSPDRRDLVAGNLTATRQRKTRGVVHRSGARRARATGRAFEATPASTPSPTSRDVGWRCGLRLPTARTLETLQAPASGHLDPGGRGRAEYRGNPPPGQPGGPGRGRRRQQPRGPVFWAIVRI